jgi:hypothetical protein
MKLIETFRVGDNTGKTSGRDTSVIYEGISTGFDDPTPA